MLMAHKFTKLIGVASVLALTMQLSGMGERTTPSTFPQRDWRLPDRSQPSNKGRYAAVPTSAAGCQPDNFPTHPYNSSTSTGAEAGSTGSRASRQSGYGDLSRPSAPPLRITPATTPSLWEKLCCCC